MRTARTSLTNKTQRLRLKVRAKPYFESVGPRRLLGYIRRAVVAGNWVAQVEIGRTETGSPVRRQGVLGLADDYAPAGAGILTHAQARAAAAVWQPGGGGGPRGAGISVKQAIEGYVAAKRASSGERAAGDAESKLQHAAPLEHRPVASLTLGELRNWRDGLVDDDERTRSTVNRILASFKAALNHAFADEANEIASDNPWRRLEAFKDADVARHDHFTTAEVDRLVTAARGFDETLADLIIAGWLTGARVGELAACNVKHFDKRHGMLMVPSGKTGARAVTLTADAIEFFSALAKGRPGAEPLLPNANGARWAYNAQLRPVKRAVRAAGLPDSASFYTLRHSYISRAIECDIPIPVICENVGTSTRMIEQNYMKIIAGRRRELLERAASATKLTLVRKTA